MSTIPGFLSRVASIIRTDGYIDAHLFVEVVRGHLSPKIQNKRGRSSELSDSDRDSYGARVTKCMLFDYVHKRAATSPTGTYSFQGMEIFATNEYLRRKAGPGDVAADDGTGGVAVPSNRGGRDPLPDENVASGSSPYIRQVRLRRHRGPGCPVWHTPHDGAWLGETTQHEFEFRLVGDLAGIGAHSIAEAYAKFMEGFWEADASGSAREYLATNRGPASDFFLDKYSEWLKKSESKLSVQKELERMVAQQAAKQVVPRVALEMGINLKEIKEEDVPKVVKTIRPEVQKLMAETLGIEKTTQSAIATAMGLSGGHSAISHAISRAVEDVTKPSQEEDDVTIPDHITGNSSQADFRKLSPEGQERVRQEEPLNRVALEEGVRQPPDHLKLAKSHFLKMTAEQRTAFDAWRATL